MSKHGYYLHGVFVKENTQVEFNKNKEQLKKEGIKSAYALQLQKNIDTQVKRNITIQQNKSIKESIKQAIRRDENIKAIGYDVEYFYKIYKSMEKYNKKLELARKKGVVLRETQDLTFPIDIMTGKINLRRLDYMEKLAERKPSFVGDIQYRRLLENIEYLFGEEGAVIFAIRSKNVPIQKIYDIMQSYNNDTLDFISKYNVNDFKENVRESTWGKMKEYHDLIFNYALPEIQTHQSKTRQDIANLELNEFINSKFTKKPSWYNINKQ